MTFSGHWLPHKSQVATHTLLLSQGTPPGILRRAGGLQVTARHPLACLVPLHSHGHLVHLSGRMQSQTPGGHILLRPRKTLTKPHPGPQPPTTFLNCLVCTSTQKGGKAKGYPYRCRIPDLTSHGWLGLHLIESTTPGKVLTGFDVPHHL